MKRRTLRMLCALLLCLGLLPVTAAAETQGSFREGGLPFTDVDQEDWYAEAVGYVYARGLMSGTGADTFGPGAAASRAMMVTSLWRMAGSPVVNYAMRFADVPQGRWYSEAVRWAASEGIAAGCGDAFGTDDPVTREQLAVMLWQFAQNQGWDVSVGEDTNILSYADAADVSLYAVPAMQWACGAGVLSGTGDGSVLAPRDPVTRAQAAAVLMRLGETAP